MLQCACMHNLSEMSLQIDKDRSIKELSDLENLTKITDMMLMGEW